jgi:hypothetical protein
MEEFWLVMIDEQGKRSKILNWKLYQRVKMMGQKLARAAQNWDIELIGLRILSFPIHWNQTSRLILPICTYAGFWQVLGIYSLQLMSFGGIWHPIDVSVVVGMELWFETAGAFLAEIDDSIQRNGFPCLYLS